MGDPTPFVWPKCGHTRTPENTHTAKKSKRERCRMCAAVYSRTERVRMHAAIYRWRRYGIDPSFTWAKYLVMNRAQGGACKLCGFVPLRFSLAVDHDHFTGRVRALLCQGYNVSLGIFERRAAEFTEYLNNV